MHWVKSRTFEFQHSSLGRAFIRARWRSDGVMFYISAKHDTPQSRLSYMWGTYLADKPNIDPMSEELFDLEFERLRKERNGIEIEEEKDATVQNRI